MPTESFCYCAPCLLNVLVIPIGHVQSSYFSECFRLLEEERVVRYKDINLSAIANSFVNAETFVEGQLLLNYVTHWSPHFEYLQDFQQWRRLYAVQTPSNPPLLTLPRLLLSNSITPLRFLIMKLRH